MTAGHGVFISHISEESPVALVLKKYLAKAFGADLPVFVSTDKTSIEPGQPWYETVIQRLGGAEAVVVLLSAESSRRIWTSFEAGFGVGSGALVIPVVLSGFSFSQLPYPLAGIQGHTIDDIGYIIDAIARRCGQTSDNIDIDEYRKDLGEAERSLNYKSLRVEPRLEGLHIKFDITNVGNVDLELLMLEVMVPSGLWDQSWGIPEWEMHPAPKPGYAWFACYSPRGAHGGFRPALRPIITPSMSTVRPNVSIKIRGPLSPQEREMPIYFQLHAVGYRNQMEERKLGDLGA